MITTSNLRRFGPYPYASDGIPTAEDSRAEGYERGLTWTAPWQPGGPFVISAMSHDRSDPDWVAFCNATRQNRDAWLAGFAEGRAAAART